MPFFAAFEAPPRPEIDEIPCIFPASREFGIFRDEFAATLTREEGIAYDMAAASTGFEGRPTPDRCGSVCCINR